MLELGGEAMNAVGKNLKQLRQRAELTQDALAERLHVTRQAVSSWETGKTQPDIETLTDLAEALHADVRELLYGPEQAPRPYARFQRRYIVCAVACGLVFLVWIALELTLVPYLVEQRLRKEYLLWPIFAYGITVSLLMYTAAGVFLPSVISLWGDIRLRSGRARRTLVILSLLILAHYVLWGAVPLLGNTLYPLLRDWYLWLLNWSLVRNGSLFLAGCMMFLGLNR